MGSMASSSPPGSADEPHEGAARLTREQISSINRFPDDNPNPVMRYDADGHLIYANPASVPILRAIGLVVGDRLPSELIARFDAVAPSRGFIEFTWQSRTYAVWPVSIVELDFTNLYGMDVTAERAIVKFPDQNPNPVMRIDWDGTLVYANPASAGLVAGLDLAVGSGLPGGLRAALLERVRAADRATVEVESGGRSYALLPVDVPEFGFVNVYGTDITAVKERERLARENERLLLNILPEPIAQRLRVGEPLIADRFDDVTLLFADIVEFTRLSSTMSAPELVGILNDVFSVFDGLVDRYDLEKVKTIGDAYMVVGGMSGDRDGHTARVAALALDLAEAVGRDRRRSPGRHPIPHRHPLRAGRRRCHRHPEVHLRHLGRHGQSRQQDGVARHTRPDPGDPCGGGATRGRLPVRGAWAHRRQGQGADADLAAGRQGSTNDGLDPSLTAPPSPGSTSGQAGGPSGTTPSCCIIFSWSMTPQCWWQSPSAPMPMMSMSCTSTLLPVAGMPIIGPVCVPVTLARTTTRSPLAMTSCTSMRMSGNAARYIRKNCITPSLVGWSPGIPRARRSRRP